MIKALILVGGEEQYHDLLMGGQVIQKLLINKGIAAHLSQDFCILNREEINEYDVCLFYTQNKFLGQEEQINLEKKIIEGMGFVPLHAASVAEHSNHGLYLKTVGCKFNYHPPFKRFQVKVDSNHFITEGLNDFMIEDELYITEYLNDPLQVLARAEQDGELHPMVYTREPGKGRVCYIALGHDGRAWYNPGFCRILYRAVLWAAGSSG